MASRMEREQWRAFLSEGTRTGKLATVRRDGSPHVVPIWFVLDEDDSLVFSTGEDSVKGKALARDPRACLTVDLERPPYAFVMVQADVEISRDPVELLRYATLIGERYMGAERAQEFGRRNAVPSELLVRLRPTHVLAVDYVSD